MNDLHAHVCQHKKPTKNSAPCMRVCFRKLPTPLCLHTTIIFTGIHKIFSSVMKGASLKRIYYSNKINAWWYECILFSIQTVFWRACYSQAKDFRRDFYHRRRQIPFPNSLWTEKSNCWRSDKNWHFFGLIKKGVKKPWTWIAFGKKEIGGPLEIRSKS